jgi:RNA polymerase sigma factor (sigma-70 family)
MFPVMTASTGELYELHHRVALGVAQSLVPADVAEDIAAEAFARVLAARRRGGGPTGDFRPYLLAAVRNLARDHLAERGRALAAAWVDPGAAAPAEGLAMAREDQRTIGRAFDSLMPRWRAVLWRSEVDGCAPAELAAEFGCSPNAVSALRMRAREGLALAWVRERGGSVTAPLPVLGRRERRRGYTPRHAA